MARETSTDRGRSEIRTENRGAMSELGVPTLADTGRIRDIASHFRKIIELLGLDLTDPNLVETPERVAKMYLELFEGLTEGAEPKVTFFPNDERYTVDGDGEGHPLLLAVLAPLRAVLRSRPRGVHPEPVDRRASPRWPGSSSSTPAGPSSRNA